MELLNEKIEKMAQPFLDTMAVYIVELNISRYRGDTAIQILADKEEGGITLRECSELNRQISQAIDNANILSGKYTLEVSSPGIDRPLKTFKDFKRAVGREVRFFLAQPISDKIEYAGRIVKVDPEHIAVEIQNQEVVIPLSVINKAKQVI